MADLDTKALRQSAALCVRHLHTRLAIIDARAAVHILPCVKQQLEDTPIWWQKSRGL